IRRIKVLRYYKPYGDLFYHLSRKAFPCAFSILKSATGKLQNSFSTDQFIAQQYFILLIDINSINPDCESSFSHKIIFQVGLKLCTERGSFEKNNPDTMRDTINLHG